MNTKQLEDFAKWFNENQWRDGVLKSAFCKCDYEKIVDGYLKQISPPALKTTEKISAPIIGIENTVVSIKTGK